jgi:hypothetical protein
MHKQISAGGCRNRKGKQKAFQSKDLFIPWRPLRPSVQNGGEIHKGKQRVFQAIPLYPLAAFASFCSKRFISFHELR